ncbi:hypothetical protein Bbelb_300560 [Branchiostoma belcheri]|nr:hypothetical protein Bbelb_300560 [Branchiostoma belcheri]
MAVYIRNDRPRLPSVTYVSSRQNRRSIRQGIKFAKKTAPRLNCTSEYSQTAVVAFNKCAVPPVSSCGLMQDPCTYASPVDRNLNMTSSGIFGTSPAGHTYPHRQRVRLLAAVQSRPRFMPGSKATLSQSRNDGYLNHS